MNNIKTQHEVARGIPGNQNSINLFDPILSCIQPQIEQNSLQVSMESNRENLERRLQLRRTIPELVSQGIYPKLNGPLAFAEQCRQLEQAKARDLLQKKLKDRPDRQCLVQHHILEDTHPLVDRSLQDKQRLLKKSKLQDNLNDLLSHRPGPLDLVSKNILLLDDESLSMTEEHTTDNEEHLFSDNSNGFGMLFSNGFEDISFGFNQSDKHDKHPSSGSFEFGSMDDNNQFVYPSLSSPEDIFSQHSPEQSTNLQSEHTSNGHSISKQDIPPAPDITPLLMASAKQPVNQKIINQDFTTLSIHTLPSNLPLITPASVASTASAYRQQKTQKKIRTKSITKPKQIKFHEYKGPPNVIKSNQQSSSKKQTQPQYEMMKLQQEQLMKWQVSPKNLISKPLNMSLIAPKPENHPDSKEHSHISPRQLNLHDMMSSVSSDVHKSNDAEHQKVHITTSIPTVNCSNKVLIKPLDSNRNIVNKMQVKFEDMKVPELRAECKRLNISCSGSKQQLLERLQMHRNSMFNHNFVIGANQPSVKSEFMMFSDNASPPVLPMDIDFGCDNAISSSNLPPVYIFDSTETTTNNNNNMLSSLQNSFPNNFFNFAHNPGMNEVNTCSQHLQHMKTLNENRKIDDGGQVTNVEDKMKLKLSEEKIVRLERDLEMARQEIKTKNEQMQLMQLMLMPINKAGASQIVNDNGNGLLNMNLALLQQQKMSHENVMKLLTQQNVNTINIANAKVIQSSLMDQQLKSHVDVFLLEQLIKSENDNKLLSNILTNQNFTPQIQQTLVQNQLIDNSFPSTKESVTSEFKSHQSPPSFTTHVIGSIASNDGKCINQLIRKNSFVDLRNDNKLGDSIRPYNDQYQNQLKANQRLNQNKNSFDSMVNVQQWNAQNQNNKSRSTGQQTHQLLQPHLNNPTIEDVLDVLSAKSDFSNICNPPQDQSHIFQGISDPQNYDISFPFVMDCSEEQTCLLRDRQPINNSLVDESVSPNSRLHTSQSEFDHELMEIFTNDAISSSNFFSQNVDQAGIANNHILFPQNVHSTVLGSHIDQNLKNGHMDMISEFDLMLQHSNCNPFDRAFSAEAVSKS